MEPFHSPLRFLLVLLTSTLLVTAGGCTSTRTSGLQIPKEPIRRVVFFEADSLRHLEPHARELAARYYPQLAASTLPQGGHPAQFDLIICPIPNHDRGSTFSAQKRIFINSEHLTNATRMADFFDKVFVHEMAHMVIEKPRGWFRRRIPKTQEKITWGESLADYARFKVLGTNGWACPECTSVFPHYIDGYSCGGAFLLHLESLYGHDFILSLIDLHREGRPIGPLFLQTTGASVDTVWNSFLATQSFTAGARASLELQRSIGFVFGKQPKELIPKLRKQSSSQTNMFLQKMFEASIEASPAYYGAPDKWQRPLLLYLYLDQPGGCAEQWLIERRNAGRLPGVAKDTKFRFITSYDFEQIDQRFPRTSTLSVEIAGEKSHCHYQLRRESTSSDWMLEKAWRSDSKGTWMEDLAVAGE